MIITFCTYFTETNDSTSFRPHCFIDLKCETISQWWLVNECFNHYPRKLIIKKLWPPKLLSKDLALTQPVESLECLYKKQTKWKKNNNASHGCSTKAFRAAGAQLPLQLVHVTVPWSLYRVQLWSTALESGLTLLWWLVASIWEKWEKSSPTREEYLWSLRQRHSHMTSCFLAIVSQQHSRCIKSALSIKNAFF